MALHMCEIQQSQHYFLPVIAEGYFLLLYHQPIYFSQVFTDILFVFCCLFSNLYWLIIFKVLFQIRKHCFLHSTVLYHLLNKQTIFYTVQYPSLTKKIWQTIVCHKRQSQFLNSVTTYVGFFFNFSQKYCFSSHCLWFNMPFST